MYMTERRGLHFWDFVSCSHSVSNEVRFYNIFTNSPAPPCHYFHQFGCVLHFYYSFYSSHFICIDESDRPPNLNQRENREPGLHTSWGKTKKKLEEGTWYSKASAEIFAPKGKINLRTYNASEFSRFTETAKTRVPMTNYSKTNTNAGTVDILRTDLQNETQKHIPKTNTYQH